LQAFISQPLISFKPLLEFIVDPLAHFFVCESHYDPQAMVIIDIAILKLEVEYKALKNILHQCCINMCFHNPTP
jgi:hypothetical protein